MTKIRNLTLNTKILNDQYLKIFFWMRILKCNLFIFRKITAFFKKSDVTFIQTPFHASNIHNLKPYPINQNVHHKISITVYFLKNRSCEEDGKSRMSKERRKKNAKIRKFSSSAFCCLFALFLRRNSRKKKVLRVAMRSWDEKFARKSSIM